MQLLECDGLWLGRSSVPTLKEENASNISALPGRRVGTAERTEHDARRCFALPRTGSAFRRAPEREGRALRPPGAGASSLAMKEPGREENRSQTRDSGSPCAMGGWVGRPDRRTSTPFHGDESHDCLPVRESRKQNQLTAEL